MNILSTIEEELSGQDPLTAFGKAGGKLGIQVIPAHSPQAKGRVERKNGVFQDRLVKDLRLRGISDITATNCLLPEFTEKLNTKFALEPAGYHQTIPEGLLLADVFCWEESRVLANDWTFRFKTRLFQIVKQSNLPPAKTRVRVLRHLDGYLHILYRNKPVSFNEPESPWRNNG